MPYFQVLRNVSFPLLQCFFFFETLPREMFSLVHQKKSELLLLISLESFAVISKLPNATDVHTTCGHALCSSVVMRGWGGGGSN